MKVTNHKRNNYHFCGSDSSVMRGSIQMSIEEWKAVKAWLKVRYQHAIDNSESYQMERLINTINYNVPIGDRAIKQNELFCLGAEATRLMFQAFGLPRYKRQNYSIKVINQIN